MRHLIRNATLAALCALVLGLATVANATRPDRPIDSPQGPPELDPTMVGDPDEPGNLRVLTVGLFGRVYLIRMPSGVLRKLHFGEPPHGNENPSRSNLRWRRHAR